MKISIRKAEVQDSDDLTRIAFAAKRYWQYPEEYFDVWKQELTLTPDYILQNRVYIANVEEKVAGFVSIVEVTADFYAGELLIRQGFWLDHIFIQPEFIGKGAGSELMAFVTDWCKEAGISFLHILSDPHAQGFYDKLGAQFIKEVPSNIQGRNVLLYKLQIK